MNIELWTARTRHQLGVGEDTTIEDIIKHVNLVADYVSINGQFYPKTSFDKKISHVATADAIIFAGVNNSSMFY